MAVVSFFVKKMGCIRHYVCRKTVYIGEKTHKYAEYAVVYTSFFDKVMQNEGRLLLFLYKLTHFSGKTAVFGNLYQRNRDFFA